MATGWRYLLMQMAAELIIDRRFARATFADREQSGGRDVPGRQ
jgi:hypothetical protein